MINTSMRTYNYYTLGAVDAYGQAQAEAAPGGTIKMSINISSHGNESP